jgi:NADPH:quinone reductase-like Zn-dependent oxidoreductase
MSVRGTMRAVVLDGPGPVEALSLRELPVPQTRPGWVLVRVRAFGFNRSELHTRLGMAEGVTFPRVPGIEASGEVVAVMMGGMGASTTAVTRSTRAYRPGRRSRSPATCRGQPSVQSRRCCRRLTDR